MTTPTTVQVRLKLRRDTAANWTAANPTLLAGECGLESDTNKIKIGNGSTAWNSLGYFPFVVSGGTVTGNLEIGTTGTLTFEGSVADGFETTLGVINPTADRTINLPNVSGTIITTGDSGTVTSTMIANGTIVDADVSASAAIAHSKLANITAGYVLIGDASNVPTATQVTGDVTISDTGVTAISSGVIVDADVSASAEIAVSKLANGTANQVIVTDGTNVSWSDDLTLAGNLTVNGTTTTINTQDLLVEDKNIIIGNVDTPTDVTADGGGITLKGATDKTINWVDSTDAWTSSERFSVPLGSASLPSLTFTGDENTGIYSPGADQLALGTNGNGRLFVDSSGRVGINTLNPITTFQVGTNGTATASLRSAETYVSIDAGYQTAAVNGTAANPCLIFGGDGNTGFWHPAADTIALSNGGSESLRITSTGLVGIGTSNPGALLNLEGNTNASLGALIYNSNALANTEAALELRHNRGNVQSSTILSAVANAGGTADLKISVSGSERARIDSSGRVGIGTITPSGIVNLDRPDLSTDTWLRVSQAGTEVFSLSQPSSSEIRFATPDLSTDREFTFYTRGLERVRIDSSGRVGIGTQSPAAALHISNSVAEIRLTDTDGDGDYANIVSGATGNLFLSADAGNGGANSYMSFLVDNTERMRITSTGEITTLAGSTPGTSTFGTAIGRAGNPGLLESYRDGAATASVCNFGGPLGNALIKCDGDLENTNNRYDGISDIKLKENIVDASSQWDDLKAIRVRNYNFKEETGYNTHTQLGLVAQEVELVSPGLVGETVNDDTGEVTKSVAYSVLYMKAVKALQEAMERIETLEAKVAALESA